MPDEISDSFAYFRSSDFKDRDRNAREDINRGNNALNLCLEILEKFD